MEVTFRPVTIEDIDSISEEYERTWGIPDIVGKEASKELSKRFVMHYMEPSTHGIIAQSNGKFMGLLFSRVFEDKVLFPQLRDMIKKQDEMMLENQDPNFSKALHAAKSMRAIETKLEAKSHINDLTQAELELFIVSPESRGHGVGGRLWKQTMQMLRSKGVNRYYLHTDTACDVSFYDYHGLRKDAVWCRKDNANKAIYSNYSDSKYLVDDLFIYSGEPFCSRTKRHEQNK